MIEINNLEDMQKFYNKTICDYEFIEHGKKLNVKFNFDNLEINKTDKFNFYFSQEFQKIYIIRKDEDQIVFTYTDKNKFQENKNYLLQVRNCLFK